MNEFLTIVLQQAIPCILLGLGIYLTYRVLDFADLTAEGSYLIGSGLTIVTIANGINPFISTIIGFLGGCACGVVTGFLNRILKIPKLLSGIITMTAAGSMILVIMGVDQETTELSGILQFFTTKRLSDTQDTIYTTFFNNTIPNNWMNIIVSSVIVLLVTVLLYFFFGTEYGMAIRSTGKNEQMSKAQGINTTVSTIVCIAISNGLIALSGSLMAQRIRSVTPNDATGYLVVGLAVILIGEAIFGKRSFMNSLISVSLGTIIYFIIIQVVYMLGFPSQLSKLLYAIMIVLALCLPMIKEWFKSVFVKLFKSGREA